MLMSYERRVTAKMKKMVGFGEIMLRLNPSGYLKVLQAEQFGASYTGAEANVCVSLCNWGWKQRFTRGYKRYKETSGLMEWKIGHIFHSIFT